MSDLFKNHFLSLKFSGDGIAKEIWDSQHYDSEQDGYLPNKEWALENDDVTVAIYCSIINASFKSYCEQQKKIDAAIDWVTREKKRIALEYAGYTTEEYVDADDLLEILK